MTDEKIYNPTRKEVAGEVLNSVRGEMRDKHNWRVKWT